MISLDNIKACSNPKCRLVLPADPDDEPNAGFWVAKREGGAGSRVLRFASWCKDCVRSKNRIRAGLCRRGKPFEQRVPQDVEARARYIAEHLRELEERHRERMTDPEYAAEYRGRDRERKRRKRREVGSRPRDLAAEVKMLSDRGWQVPRIARHLHMRPLRVYTILDPERTVEIVERDREASRAWKRNHPAKVERHAAERVEREAWAKPEAPFYQFVRDLQRVARRSVIVAGNRTEEGKQWQ